MEKFYELKNLKFAIRQKNSFDNMNCFEDSPVYEDVLECFEEVYEDMLALVEPVGVLGVGTMPEVIASEKYPVGTPVIFAVTSIGDGIKQQSTKAFQECDYVKGMLLDCMADDALFSMEDQLVAKVQEICGELGMGVLARLEAPHDIPMDAQKAAWEYLELKKRFDIDISCGFMFDPVKTSCQIFVLTEDKSIFKAQHDCRKCPNVNCKLRKIPDAEILVHKGTETGKIFVKDGVSLLDALIQEKYYVTAVCGGKGRCGKCKVRVIKGEASVTEADAAVFSEKELAEGWRLSCRLYPMDDLEISLEQNDETEFEILTGFGDSLKGVGIPVEQQKDRCENSDENIDKNFDDNQDDTQNKVIKKSMSEYDVAVDIGTTTIVLSLVEKESGKILHSVSTINGQRVYGADVISRIKASTEGKKQELQDSVRNDLKKGFEKLLQETGVLAEHVKRFAIGANTTMGHLLMGYDCDTLGVYPFTPVNIDYIKGSDKEILGFGEGAMEVIILPGISTYVGGDIVSGLYACGFHESAEICLLVDLGTNGEMALGNKDKILVTSTAAGPAFEGGNITWGTGSIPGAIASAEIDGTDVKVTTIGNQPPQGICGTGVVEITAELVREEIVLDTGAMDDDYFDEGFPIADTPDGKKIVFTRKDVREIQLAKAAIRAGLETLILRYGIEKEDVAKVYVAGGFGYKLNIAKAIAIGMFPAEFAGRIEAVGNSSLAGAVKYLQKKEGESIISGLVESSTEIGLSSDKDFNEFYMDYMFFEAED